MRAVVCQGEPVGGAPSREDVVAYWKEQLAGIPEITSVDYRENFKAGDVDEIEHGLVTTCSMPIS